VAVMDQGRHDWSVYVEYLVRKGPPVGGSSSGAGVVSNGPRVDYREELTKPELERFSLLRDLRKQVAAREAVPVYAVFTNAQLAEFARKVPKSKAVLGKVEGVGDAKAFNYWGCHPPCSEMDGRFPAKPSMPDTFLGQYP
jgi:superfamily II DNA helicase RecQ